MEEMMDTTVTQQLIGEFFGTFLLMYLGNSINAAHTLKKSKAYQSGWLHITLGWGLAVTMSIYAIGWLSPAHLNPAVTVGMFLAGEVEGSLVLPYIVVQFIGAFLGATAMTVHYFPHFKETKDPADVRGVFSTGPAIREKKWNLISETLATAVLVYGLLAFTQGDFTEGLNPVVVGLLILLIGMALGGTTGYAINPARDLGPRVAHACLPIPNKGDSDWGYSWIPVVGPFLGAAIGALGFQFIIGLS